MKHGLKRLTRYVLVAAISFSLAVPAMAATKEEVQNQIDNLKNQQSELESQLESLKKNKTDTESYIKDLDEKIKVYLGKVQEVSAQIEETEAEIALTQENLEQAKEDEQQQYKALKARIKAMYESGNVSYVQMLLGSGDLKSLLNDQEYISKINEYDHNLLTNLQQIRDQIAAYEAELEEQKELQEAQKEEYELEKASLEKVVAEKEEELIAIGADIDSVNYNIVTTQEEIDAENALLAEIIEQERKAAEEAARRKAEEEEARRRAEEEAQKQQSESSSSSGGYEGSSPSSPSSSTGMIWPVGSTYITSYFGYRNSPTAGASTYHQGIDIAASEGSAIWAAASGTVTTASYSSAMGNYVVISHGNGLSTVYEHCSALYVSAGDYVSQGSTIAAVGSTGISTGAHLHFGVMENGSYVNPLYYVSP
ncbi:MAG: murein hydrolase activator EnvC family protein [Coprococcus sp.]